MAQATSAQREPSMEEILASIRRIIEDSDVAQKPGPAAARYPANEPAAAVRSEIDAFRSELRPAPEVRPEPRTAPAEPVASIARNVEPAPPAGLAPKTFRLAEVQAQVAREAASARSAETERTPVTLAEVQQQLAREGNRTTTATVSVVSPAMATAVVHPAARVATAASTQAQPVDETRPSVEPRPSAEASYEKPRDLVPVDFRRSETAPAASSAPVAAGDPASKPGIISPVAGRQVAAAFGELSEAFAARSKKTFEDLAEQMMRPMLQDWLDNNLPVLVERLVREEIERVARGVE
jgi:cell pole-organizing protein PopZ